MTTTDETGPSFLKVAVLVDNTGGGTAKPSDFTIDMRTSFETGPYPNMFDGSENGTIVAMNTPGAYIINVNQKETVNTPYGIEFSGDCSFDYGNGGRGSTNPGDKQTCIVTMIYPNF